LPRPAALLRTAGLGALALLFAVLTALRFLSAPLDRFDEGLTLTTAAMTAAGRTIYRDFWTTYGPLNSSLLAAAFRIFGEDVLVERCLAVAVALSFAAAAYALTTVLRLPRPMRFLMTFLLAVVPQSVGFLVAAFTADLFALLALALFMHGLEGPVAWLPAAVGALTGVTAFGRPELGVALATGLLAGYGILVACGRSRLSRTILPYLAGAILGGGALWLPVLIAAGLGPVLYTFAVYPLTLYRAGRGIPIGQGDAGPAILAFTTGCLVVWVWSARRAWTLRAQPADLARLVVVLVPAILAFTWVVVRADAGHALAAWPFTAAALTVVLARRQQALRSPAGGIGLLALVGFCLVVGGLGLRDATALAGAGAGISRAQIPRAHAWLDNATLAAVILAIDQDVPPGRPLFVGALRNDRAPFNDVTLYFLAGRLPGTVYYETVPALTSSQDVQRRIICQLQQAAVSLVVLGPTGEGEPTNASSREGARDLDRWIAAHTVSRRDVGPYALLTLGVAPSELSCAPSDRAVS